MKTLIIFAFASVASLNLTEAAGPPATPLPANVQHALASVSANEMKGDLSFLASDTLQGRFTPSPGLDVAAEFIASKFRAAGLEPGGDHDYFQTAEMLDRQMPTVTSDLTLFVGDQTVVVPAATIYVKTISQAAHLDHVPVVFMDTPDAALLKDRDLKGKAVVTVETDLKGLPVDRLRAEIRKVRAFDQAVASSGALLNVTIRQVQQQQFVFPRRLLFIDQVAAGGSIASLSIRSKELEKVATEQNRAAATVSFDIPAPMDTKVWVKNVIGILRGSDPVLAKTALLLTAHYDHIGTVETAGQMSMHATGDSKDRIFNGANDDGSGTVSVVEIARAMAQLKPKRSIVFVTFFGEERGELGSQFYGKHPVFPLAETVADINLEQVGRTDSTVGPQLNNASVTGFDYSDVTGYLVRAGQQLGIKVYRDAEASDAYFTRSDNDALAQQGVPAHTLCVAFDYPDYHGLGDEWQKIDYENMAKVDRMVLLALLNIADSVKAPEWNAQNVKTEHFREVRAAAQESK
jgi:hypothetical protein